MVQGRLRVGAESRSHRILSYPQMWAYHWIGSLSLTCKYKTSLERLARN